MKTRIKMLKVKVKSLAEEARIIRLEESRSEAGSQQQCELHQHRVMDVRKEQRSSLLAYAFLRGVPLAKVEARSKVAPDWKRVAQIVDKFGAVEHREKTEQSAQWNHWKAEAGASAA